MRPDLTAFLKYLVILLSLIPSQDHEVRDGLDAFHRRAGPGAIGSIVDASNQGRARFGEGRGQAE